eukprot:983385-Rhodomonas_salina.1
MVTCAVLPQSLKQILKEKEVRAPLRARYAVSGTEVGYAAMQCAVTLPDEWGTKRPEVLGTIPAVVLRARDRPTHLCYRPTRPLCYYPTRLMCYCPTPALCYRPTRSLRRVRYCYARYALSGTVVAYAATRSLGGARSSTAQARSAISLRARYAMSGTDIACAAICLRTRYAMSSTDIGQLRYFSTRMLGDARLCPALTWASTAILLQAR